jgi:hypothetical protein
VDGAFHAHQRGGGRRGHAVLSRAGLGDDLLLAHALGQQNLADGVVDLVRAEVVQILALEVDLGPAAAFGQVGAEIERIGTARELLLIISYSLMKSGSLR